MFAYLKAPWPENPVPEGEPHWIYHEVEIDRDVVTRMVELFADGSLVRASTEFESQKDTDQRDTNYRSLVHGQFSQLMTDAFTPIAKSEFELLWDQAARKI